MLSTRLVKTLDHGASRSPAGEIVQVEVQRASGVPASDIFSPPCLHHLSSSLGFLVVLDGPSRRRGSFLPSVPTGQTNRFVLPNPPHAFHSHNHNFSGVQGWHSLSLATNFVKKNYIYICLHSLSNLFQNSFSSNSEAFYVLTHFNDSSN